MVMPPVNLTHDGTFGISFLLFLLSRSAPLLKGLTRGLNQGQKRPGGPNWEIFGFIEAQVRRVPVLERITTL